MPASQGSFIASRSVAASFCSSFFHWSNLFAFFLLSEPANERERQKAFSRWPSKTRPSVSQGEREKTGELQQKLTRNAHKESEKRVRSAREKAEFVRTFLLFLFTVSLFSGGRNMNRHSVTRVSQSVSSPFFTFVLSLLCCTYNNNSRTKCRRGEGRSSLILPREIKREISTLLLAPGENGKDLLLLLLLLVLLLLSYCTCSYLISRNKFKMQTPNAARPRRAAQHFAEDELNNIIISLSL